MSKRFGGVPALSDVSLTVAPGTVHALIGENGAGKSTLGKIISGVIEPDEGTLTLGGRPLALRSPREAIAHGIVTIAQELAIVPGLTVAENVYLGSEVATAGFVRRRELRRRFRELAQRGGIRPLARRPGRQPVASPTSRRSRSCARCRATPPSWSWTSRRRPSRATRRPRCTRSSAPWRARGSAVVLISHFLSEVLSLSDTITTLRDGHLVRTVEAAGATEDSLIEGMLGRSLSSAFPDKVVVAEDAPVVLEVDHVSAPGVTDCSFTLRAGRSSGIAGLVGAGRSELARAIFRDAKVSTGTVRLDGAELAGHSPHRSIRRGLVLIPESRKEMGLLMGRSVRENVSLSRLDLVSRLGWIAGIRERRTVSDLMDDDDRQGGEYEACRRRCSRAGISRSCSSRAVHDVRAERC